VTEGYTLSNGIAWNAEGDVFYHADSLERVVRRYQWDHDRGSVEESGRLEFTEDDGLPDGIALDIDGGLWIAFWGTGQVRRYDHSGSLDCVLELPVPNSTAVAFAGDDLSTLLITTAKSTRDGFVAEGSGCLYACEVGIQGIDPMIFVVG
jgi:sugar lactone lactonase YvrE